MFIIIGGLMLIGALTGAGAMEHTAKQKAEIVRIEEAEAAELISYRLRQAEIDAQRVAEELAREAEKANQRKQVDKLAGEQYYEGKKKILTAKEHCEKVQYDQELCWKIERTK